MSEPSPNVTVARALQEVSRATASALIKLTGRPQKSVINTLKNLHHQSKIHIGAYTVNKRGQIAKVWVWEAGDDAMGLDVCVLCCRCRNRWHTRLVSLVTLHQVPQRVCL